MKFVILSSSPKMIGSIERYLKYVHSIADVKSFLLSNQKENAYENFLIIKDWIENLYRDSVTDTKETMAFIDLPLIKTSELKATSNSVEGLVSLLYLAFPGIYWFFSTPFADEISDERLTHNDFKYFHILSDENGFGLKKAVKNFLHGYSPLFDPIGFRNFIIKNTLEKMKGEDETIETIRPFFCERKEKALVTDEELSYSYLHSYVAYKFDFRPMMAPTNRILTELEEKGIGEFKISFEDIGLSFPDEAIKYEAQIRHSLMERDRKYKFIKKIQRRIFVTIGEKRKLKKINRGYRKNLKKEAGLKFYKVLYKPYAGILNLQKEAKLKPKKYKNVSFNEKSGEHSQPGRLGMLASILINRSRKILRQADSAINAVHAAILALQAQEILGGRTATLSIEAISLKHQAEVLAECMFYGVEHNFDVKNRFKEIENELHIIGRWFSKSKRDIMIYNSELNIVNELARIFRNYSQFDEEQKCLNKVRTLNRKIYRKRNKFWGWLVSPLRWYFEFLVGSLPRFLAAIALWPALFTLLFYLFLPNTNNVNSLGNAFICSINSFFALQVTIIKGVPGVPILSILATLLGFFHLGIFISHLYTIVSRR